MTEAIPPIGDLPARDARASQTRTFSYTITPCPLGYLLVAATAQGICAVRLGDSFEELAATLAPEFPDARPAPGHAELANWTARIQDYLRGAQPHLDLPLDIQGTAFQRRVWQALKDIPYGSTRSYSQVAATIGQPTAARAVASACAANRVALVVPCHRVVRGDGGLGGYRWGIERKRALLALEAQFGL